MKRVAIAAACLAGFAVNAGADSTFYRYKDENGNWVYTDLQPSTERHADELLRSPEESSPPVRVFKQKSPAGVDVIVDNPCFCPVLVLMAAESLSGLTPRNGPAEQKLVAARTHETLMQLTYDGAPEKASFGYRYAVLYGDPKAEHRPTEPYRAPFAVAQRFRISQAFPSRRTHTDAGSFYAIDISMPVGTQIYAARAGTVIEVAARFFEGNADPKNAARANLVRILQPDGTMAIYAHLQWDSIRVRPGQIVKRGQYIANSGNTGFTTGPHLHFAVQKNSGLAMASLPVEFAGPAGSAVTPKDGDLLIAY
ncbi:MAG: peptidoglycan DD-metalloendopeptidase family protein [Steroidobacterales bacterium]